MPKRTLNQFASEQILDHLTQATSSAAEKPGLHIKGHIAEIVTELTESRHPDIPTIMEMYHLDPEQWVAYDVVGGRYEGQQRGPDGEPIVIAMWQFKVKFKLREVPTIVWPDLDYRWTPPAPRPKLLEGRPRLILITTDLQVPFHDPELHELSLEFAHDNKIDEWGDLGDIHDFDQLSKHRRKPEWTATPQETIDTVYKVFRGRNDALPAYADRWWLRGNHDVRMRNWLLDHAKELFGITRAAIDDTPLPSVLDIGYLSRLDELGWDQTLSPHGEYPYEERVVVVDPPLLAGHGTEASGIAGISARKMVERRYGTSYMQGHTNKLSILGVSQQDEHGDTHFRFAIEAGMMGLVEGGMGFSPEGRNWQPGFVVITAWPSGGWSAEIVPFVNHEIKWRGQVWRNKASATSRTTIPMKRTAISR